LKVAKAVGPNVALHQCYDGEMEAALGIAVNERLIRLAGSLASTDRLSVQSRQLLPEPVRSMGTRFRPRPATAIEYGPIAAGILLAIISVVNGIGAKLSSKFASINSSLR
jgi:pilus assembly protein Flp/PilA